jgi:hypothetical protein
MALCALFAGCAGHQQHIGADELRRIRSIEVVVDVPSTNFVYESQSTTLFLQPGAGVSMGAALGAAVVVNLVAAGIEHAVTATAREASAPVGRSVRDLDLRGTTFSQLQAMTAGHANTPAWNLSASPIPKPKAVEIPPEMRSAPPGIYKPDPVDPIKPLIEHAKASSSDATLFVNVLPLFRAANGQGALVQSTSSLYDKSGKLLSTWTTTFIGPTAPDAERSDIVQWWADQRYRRFIAQGIRAVMRPIAEEFTQPEVVARRRADMARLLTPKAELRADPTQRTSVSQSQESTANAMRMRSTVCAVDGDDKRVIYRYERHSRGEYLAVSAYCPGEQLNLWNQDLMAGMSWLSEPLPAPTVVTRAVKDDEAVAPQAAEAPVRRPAAR